MCGPVIGLVLGIASSFAGAMITSGQAKQEAVIEQEQLKVEIENEKIKGMQDTNNRLEQFRKDEASNRAALSTSGIDNWSYIEGIEPANREIMRRDVRTMQFNVGQEVGRKKYEIAVSGWKAKSAKRKAYLEAGASAVGQVGSFLLEGGGASLGGGGSGNAQYPAR